MAHPTRIAARAAWILPVFFGFLCLQQGLVAYDLNQTLERGVDATAELTEVHIENRVDVTYDYVSLRVNLPDGGVLERKEVSLPHSLVPALEKRETVSVRVVPETGEVVLTEVLTTARVVDTQMRIALMNAAISFGAALLFGIGIFYWNRSLARDGDPAERGVTEPDPDHPARQMYW